MTEHLPFPTRDAFRQWLTQHAETSEGVWLLFDTSGFATLKPSEALEEALCFGWIDGQMKRIDAQHYIKYFCLRRKNSKWSDKNKAIVAELQQQGLMTELGLRMIELAKQNGQWDKPKPPPITDEQIDQMSELLREYDLARTNFLGMSPSVKRTYTRGYLEAKTDAGRKSRLAWMVDRLAQNLKPM